MLIPITGDTQDLTIHAPQSTRKYTVVLGSERWPGPGPIQKLGQNGRLQYKDLPLKRNSRGFENFASALLESRPCLAAPISDFSTHAATDCMLDTKMAVCRHKWNRQWLRMLTHGSDRAFTSRPGKKLLSDPS